MSLKPLPPPPSRTRVLLPSDVPDFDVLQEQIEDARAIAQAMEERIDRALALHALSDFPGSTYCVECDSPFPCDTVRALTGDDEDDQDDAA